MAIGGLRDDSVLLSVDVVISAAKYNLYGVDRVMALGVTD
jgi:hypothetical protein